MRAIELEGFNSKFVRVYTDQGLTGTGEMVDTLSAAQMINEQLGPSILGRDPLDIEGIYFHFWSWGKVPRTTWPAKRSHWTITNAEIDEMNYVNL